MNISFYHQPVMLKEIMSLIENTQGKIFVDATAGGGGHLLMLTRIAGETGRVFAFDKDPRAHREDAAMKVAHLFPHVVHLFQRPFSQIKETLSKEGVSQIDGIICDLGVSSHQLDDKSRGFSFLADGPIDMRMDPTTGISAYDWLAFNSEQVIADTLFNLGGERKSRAIARLIKKSWPIENSTLALAKLVLSGLRQRAWSKIHPATRTFQAIRMAVNHEVDELSALLSHLPDLLAVDGVAIFLAFHSVEDRLIKNAFKEMALNNCIKTFEILTKKPLTVSKEEITQNRRARSAKLRAIKRVS